MPWQQTRYMEPMLVHCWPSVVDGGPALNQHRVTVSCSRGGGGAVSTDLQGGFWEHKAAGRQRTVTAYLSTEHLLSFTSGRRHSFCASLAFISAGIIKYEG